MSDGTDPRSTRSPAGRPLADRVVVVTGGNGGIGLGIARGLADAGATVAIWARNDERNAEAVAELESMGAAVAAWSVDVTDEDRVGSAMAATVERFGRVDSMVANAGGSALSPFVDQTLQGWRAVTALNLDGVFLCFRAACRHMVDRHEAHGDKGGALVAVSSTSAWFGAPGNEAYAASKAAVLALVRGLAVEMARHGIRANSMVPGWTETDLTAPLQQWDAFMEATTNRTPVRRWGVPQDFAAAAVYLADPTHTFHTGDHLVIDGGYTIF